MRDTQVCLRERRVATSNFVPINDSYVLWGRTKTFGGSAPPFVLLFHSAQQFRPRLDSFSLYFFSFSHCVLTCLPIALVLGYAFTPFS